MTTVRLHMEADNIAARRIDFNDVEVLLRYEVYDKVCGLIDRHYVYIANIFSSQKDIDDLEDEPVISNFFRDDTFCLMEKVHEVLKYQNITPSANIMMAIANRIMYCELFARNQLLVLGFISLFKNLYQDKKVFKSILETPTARGHTLFTFLAQWADAKYLQELIDEFQIDINALNQIEDDLPPGYLSTGLRIKTLTRVVEALILAHMYKSENHGPNWIQAHCEVITLLVSRNASMEELASLFESRGKETQEKPVAFFETKSSIIKNYLDGAELAFEAIKKGLALKPAQPAQLSTATGGLYAPQKEVNPVAAIAKVLHTLAMEYNELLKQEGTQKLLKV